MLISVLTIHVLIAFAVGAGFIARYILAFRQKAYPKEGRKTLYAGSAILVVTGVGLAIIGKLPVTGLCLDSLGIIAALIALELGLQFMSTRLAEERIRTDKK